MGPLLDPQIGFRDLNLTVVTHRWFSSDPCVGSWNPQVGNLEPQNPQFESWDPQFCLLGTLLLEQEALRLTLGTLMLAL